ncbi:Chromatin assembly factor 1 subunit A [Cynara cardunculus var. scolymus]|uniref:Chromatin assembly factor 1 subunit A n=1 Tax=Cynara cardunculus var. scolymus TaxID=59895 RepID=A0A103YEC0_CYNCS|nr:Chromatin assembly factor 1 subunit A [Cynara cardunculus var. scolymus]
MGDAMVVDGGKKATKRKRVELVMSIEEKEARIDALREEIDGLIKYYKEFNSKIVMFNVDSLKANYSGNSMIACFLEESSLPLSKLVESIFDSVKDKEGSMTPASVKSSVLLIGQRSFYGVQNPNADVLEDESPSGLWCWETRDLKLLPKSFRGELKIRRTCRKKIHERITAVSESPSAQKVMKASERLGKVLSEAEIRLLVEKMQEKNGIDVAEKEVKKEEKLVVKQLEKNKREVEKEKMRMERELLKEKLQSEKELRRLQDEAEKEEKRRETEIRKQLKKQQEEADKEQRRREKEEAEQKRQHALQKQASILERFLKKSKSGSPVQADQSLVKASGTDISPKQRVHVSESVIQSMDDALTLNDEFDEKELWKVHLDSWHRLVHCSSKKRHWGIRQTPKTVVVTELKLTNRGLPCEENPSVEKFDDGWTEAKNDCKSSVFGSQKFGRSKQLLQFDKSHRPAFYGHWPKKRARCPLVKDPDLDYEIDSDEEWEEEEPGESLSDCDKEDDDETMEENLSKVDDEDESEDGFFVPDGYLSENEGVEVERMDHTNLVEDARSSPSCAQLETEELSVLFRQLKHLNSLTEHALRKNRPLVILNLIHEKPQSLLTQDHSESEQMCLQALSIRVFPVGPPIEILAGDDIQEEVQEDCPSSSKGGVVPLVSVIQSCPHGINKVVSALRSKFPNIPKSQLGSKVKKDILEKYGLSSSPEKTARRTKSIAAFFSKRCLPPAGKTTNPNQVSPQSTEKTSPGVEMQNNTYNSQ